MNFPCPPSLYRWKGFEPALAYVDRGVNFHGLLPLVLEIAIMSAGDVDPAELAQDWDDMSPGAKQLIRGTKILEFLRGTHCKERLLLAHALSQPLTHYMTSAFSLDQLIGNRMRGL